MSNTIAHRPHVHHHHVPLAPVLAIVLTIAIAAVVIWALNQPQTPMITTTGGATVSVPIFQPQEVPAPRSPVVRHAEMRVSLRGESAQIYLARSLHRTEGTLDALSATRHLTLPVPKRNQFGASGSVR